MNTEQEILDLKNPWESYYYCCDNEKTANINAHEKIIINSKSLQYCYWFARDIEKSNKQLLFKVVLKSGDLDYIKRFYNYINFDKSEFETLMLFI
jgi:hypothetical protein